MVKIVKIVIKTFFPLYWREKALQEGDVRMKVSEKDLLIVSCLRQDARMKLTDMSKVTKIPVSTLFDKVINYRGKGVIKKNTSIVRFERLGYPVKALIVFSTRKKDRQRLFELLNSNDNVNSLFKINNGWDFLAEVIFPGIKEVEEFIENIEEQVRLKSKKAFYIIDEIKKEGFLANPRKTKLLWRR